MDKKGNNTKEIKISCYALKSAEAATQLSRWDEWLGETMINKWRDFLGILSTFYVSAARKTDLRLIQ